MVPFTPPAFLAPSPQAASPTDGAAPPQEGGRTFAESLSSDGERKSTYRSSEPHPQDVSPDAGRPFETPPDLDMEEALNPPTQEGEEGTQPELALTAIIPTSAAVAPGTLTAGDAKNALPAQTVQVAMAKWGTRSDAAPTVSNQSLPNSDDAPLVQTKQAIPVDSIRPPSQVAPLSSQGPGPAIVPPTAQKGPATPVADTTNGVQSISPRTPDLDATVKSVVDTSASDQTKTNIASAQPTAPLPIARLLTESLAQTTIGASALSANAGQSSTARTSAAAYTTSATPVTTTATLPFATVVNEAVSAVPTEGADPITRIETLAPLPDRIIAAQSLPQNMTSTDQTRQITQQLATAMPTTLPGTTEILLQPEELGRVRMTLTVQDGAMTLVIQAERADTTDLLRRNLDQLAQTYRQMGFETLNFSFAGSTGQDTPTTEGIDDNIAATLADDDSETLLISPTASSQTATTRLDLRI